MYIHVKENEFKSIQSTILQFNDSQDSTKPIFLILNCSFLPVAQLVLAIQDSRYPLLVPRMIVHRWTYHAYSNNNFHSYLLYQILAIFHFYELLFFVSFFSCFSNWLNRVLPCKCVLKKIAQPFLCNLKLNKIKKEWTFSRTFYLQLNI